MSMCACGRFQLEDESPVLPGVKMDLPIIEDKNGVLQFVHGICGCEDLRNRPDVKVVQLRAAPSKEIP